MGGPLKVLARSAAVGAPATSWEPRRKQGLVGGAPTGTPRAMSGPWVSWIKDEDFAKDFLIELWDAIEAKVLTDDGRPQGTILLGRAGPPESPSVGPLHFGSVGVFEFVAASDDYYAWWMLQAEATP